MLPNLTSPPADPSPRRISSRPQLASQDAARGWDCVLHLRADLRDLRLPPPSPLHASAWVFSCRASYDLVVLLLGILCSAAAVAASPAGRGRSGARAATLLSPRALQATGARPRGPPPHDPGRHAIYAQNADPCGASTSTMSSRSPGRIPGRAGGQPPEESCAGGPPAPVLEVEGRRSTGG